MKSASNLIIFFFILLALVASAYAADSQLHKAVQKGDNVLVESLLSMGADVNAKDTGGDTPLHFAAYFGMNEIIESLLARGADINAMSKVMAPLHMAIDAGRTETAELLLTKSADINVKDINGNTPLHHAVMFQGNKGVVEFLLTKGADITVKNRNGATPQEEAVRLGKKDIAELLNEHLVSQAKQAGRVENLIRSNPRAALVELTAQLKNNPADDSIRRLIIKIVSDLKPAPALPEEAKRHFIMAGIYQKEARNPSDFALAITAYRDAIMIVPWLGAAYYNLSVSLESAGRLDEAKEALEFYLLTKPKDAEEAQNRLYVLDAKKNLSAKQASEKNSPEARAASQIQSDEELVRSLDGVRFDSPASLWMAGSSELNEHWVVINGGRLTLWDKVIRADPDIALANPREHALGAVSQSSFPIVRTVARGEGWNSNISFRITSDSIFMDSTGKLFRTYSRR